MSNIARMMQRATAGAGGAGLDVDEVFSTFVYTGNNTARTITNGIDLTEGGLVWTKARDSGVGHALVDTVRGNTKYLESNATAAEASSSVGITAFNSTGYTLGADNTWAWNVSNSYVSEYVSWTFRKAPKFFDVVTYTGNGTAGRTVSHNLGSVPGMLIIRRRDTGASWYVHHRELANTDVIFLDSAAAKSTNQTRFLNSTTPTATEFTLGDEDDINGSGGTYVAYLFAHNNNDGEFGPDGDADIIKCGSYSGTSSSGNAINLGFEPQWVLIKNATTSVGDWYIYDSMRGVITGSGDREIEANDNATEAASSGGSQNWIDFNATGFSMMDNYEGVNQSGKTYIYMAIRRGPLAVPDDATKVFGVNYAYTYDVNGSTGGSSAQLFGYIGEPSDLNIQGYRNGSSYNAAVYDRLRGGKYLVTNTNSAEGSVSGNFWDNMAGFSVEASAQDTTYVSWVWKRAPSYFDVVGYVGAGAAQTVNHNLGVVPEMMWIKNRDSAENWAVYHSALGTSKYLHLNTTDAGLTTDAANRWNNTSPTATQFTVGTSTEVSHFTRNFVAYLFATVAGVSKVGSVSHTSGSTTNVDCGFSSGARFVILKASSIASQWMVFDTVRGIVSGVSPFMRLNQTGAEATSTDIIDPYSTGFAIDPTVSTATYIFYAIA